MSKGAVDRCVVRAVNGWLDEVEGFGTRGERFFEDSEAGNYHCMLEWLQWAAQVGYDLAKDGEAK